MFSDTGDVDDKSSSGNSDVGPGEGESSVEPSLDLSADISSDSLDASDVSFFDCFCSSLDFSALVASGAFGDVDDKSSDGNSDVGPGEGESSVEPSLDLSADISCDPSFD